MCISFSVWVCACEHIDYEGQKRTFDSLVQELQLVGSHQIWVLGTKLRSSARHLSSSLDLLDTYPFYFLHKIFSYLIHNIHKIM